MKQRPQLYMYSMRFYAKPMNGYLGTMYYLSDSPNQFFESCEPFGYFRAGNYRMFQTRPSWFKHKVDLQLAAINKMGFQVNDMTKQQEYV